MAELVFLVPFGTGNSVAAVPVAWVCANIGLWYVNCSIPAESELSRQAYGYLIVTEGEYFSRFHCDSAETLDSLITLHGAGGKVWFFIKPGPLGRMMEDTYYDSMMACLREHGSQLKCCVQKVGDTIYLPYAWIDCVLTIGNVGGCSSLLSLGLRVPRERYEHVRINSPEVACW